MNISEKLYEKILRDFRYHGAEKGGLAFLHQETIDAYWVDEKGIGTVSSFKPNIKEFRKAIASYKDKQYSAFIFIHSHPEHEDISAADIAWLRGFMCLNGLECLKTLLVQNDKITSYLITPTSYFTIPIYVYISEK